MKRLWFGSSGFTPSNSHTSSRPAPEPVIGLESNKLDSTAFKNHLSNFTDILLEKTAPRKNGVGWTGFHMDSWESGSQNWTEGIEEQFKKQGLGASPFTETNRAYEGEVSNIKESQGYEWTPYLPTSQNTT